MALLLTWYNSRLFKCSARLQLAPRGLIRLPKMLTVGNMLVYDIIYK